jgi:hypothetical protein
MPLQRRHRRDRPMPHDEILRSGKQPGMELTLNFVGNDAAITILTFGTATPAGRL